MATMRVKNREFQRKPAEWLQRARDGQTVVIVSPQGPDLTLHMGSAPSSKRNLWKDHLEWLKKQPMSKTNPVDDLRHSENR